MCLSRCLLFNREQRQVGKSRAFLVAERRTGGKTLNDCNQKKVSICFVPDGRGRTSRARTEFVDEQQTEIRESQQ